MKESPSKKPSRLPILLSAFVCPGVGQFVQNRWVAGVVFVVGFFWSFCWVMVLALGNIADYYRFGFEFETCEPDPTAPSAFIAPLALAGGFYLVNLIDVFAAQQRIARARREAAFGEFNG